MRIRFAVAFATVVLLAVVVANSSSAPAAPPCVPPVVECTTTTTAESPTTATEPPATTTTESTTTTTATDTAAVTVDTTPFVEPAPTTDTTVIAGVPRAPRAPVLRSTPIGFGGITASAVTGSFGLGFGTVLVLAIGFIGLSALSRRGRRITAMETRRWRFLAAIGCLAIAAIIGIVGYLKLSLEPAVNRQIPYLASAGMGLVLFAAVGGSLLVAEQMRTDDARIEQLEEAVRRLADAVAPAVEAPARRK